jgi:hypothetical protein
LQAASGWAAPTQTHAVQQAARSVRTLISHKHEISQADKNSAGHAIAAQPNRQTLVSVGPQAMSIERIRDIAMAPTG